jgi:hypothetical protein
MNAILHQSFGFQWEVRSGGGALLALITWYEVCGTYSVCAEMGEAESFPSLAEAFDYATEGLA